MAVAVLAGVTAATLAAFALTDALLATGLPDPGPVTTLGLPFVRAVGEIAAAVTVGGLLFATFFVPPQASGVLDAEGYTMVLLPQNSATMADAYQLFYSMMSEGSCIHAGDDPEFAAHVLSTAAIKSDRGWRVSKMRQRQRIDALVAAVMANYGAVVQAEETIVPGFFSV